MNERVNISPENEGAVKINLNFEKDVIAVSGHVINSPDEEVWGVSIFHLSTGALSHELTQTFARNLPTRLDYMNVSANNNLWLDFDDRSKKYDARFYVIWHLCKRLMVYKFTEGQHTLLTEEQIDVNPRFVNISHKPGQIQVIEWQALLVQLEGHTPCRCIDPRQDAIITTHYLNRDMHLDDCFQQETKRELFLCKTINVSSLSSLEEIFKVEVLGSEFIVLSLRSPRNHDGMTEIYHLKRNPDNNRVTGERVCGLNDFEIREKDRIFHNQEFRLSADWLNGLGQKESVGLFQVDVAKIKKKKPFTTVRFKELIQ